MHRLDSEQEYRFREIERQGQGIEEEELERRYEVRNQMIVRQISNYFH